jgi:hypothetical protein
VNSILRVIWLFALALALAGGASGEEIFVDLTLAGDCPGTYNTSVRSCGGGTETAFDTLDEGLAAAQPGDDVILRSGSYGSLSPPSSGQPGSPITIRNHENEAAIIENLSSEVAISMDFLSYVTIQGLEFDTVRGFGHIYDCHHIVISGCRFSSSGVGTTGSMKLARTTFSRIVNNSFSDSGGDQMVLQDASDHNLIAGNSFFAAYHSLLSIRCSEQNIIRDNQFDNPDQKAVEIYDCEGTSDAPYRLDSTARNVFEGNAFIRTRADTDDHSYNAIQHGAQHTIVRRNIFRGCLGGGVNYQHYSDESLYVYGNRMAQNTFYDNRCHGIIGDDPNDPTLYYDHQVMNNLLYLNRDCTGGGGQIRIPDPTVVVLSHNALATQDPGFVDEAGFDFRLEPTSPHLDQGGFVTATSTAGTGTILPVDDAGWFHDGLEVVGENGDLIQLQGQTTRVRVVDVDYTGNTLTLAQPLGWSAGLGVHLAYTGDAPDAGAFERGLDGQIFSDGFESGDLSSWVIAR